MSIEVVEVGMEICLAISEVMDEEDSEILDLGVKMGRMDGEGSVDELG